LPFVNVRYPKSVKGYTFYTIETELRKDDVVVVHDKGGYSICTVIAYTSEPEFPCCCVIFSPRIYVGEEKMINAMYEAERKLNTDN